MNSELDEDSEEAGEDSEEGAGEDLPEGVLAKEHTATADEAADEDAEGEPPDWVEGEDEAVGKKGANNTASTGRVNGNLPPEVDKQA